MRNPEIWLAMFFLVACLLPVAALWRTFTKAGEAGWKAIIPIWNVLVLLRIAGRPAWWLILMLIPFVSFVIWIIVAIDISNAFGRSGGFAAGLVLLSPIFLLILGFGSARYLGTAGAFVGRHGPVAHRA